MTSAVYPELKMRVGYGYDVAGRMNVLSYPGGETVRYERDRAGRVTAVVDSVAGRTEMGYDLLGRQVSQRWPNGLSETRTYDSASRLLAITPGQQDKKGAPTIIYTYDQRGNRLTMNRSDVGPSAYTYDEISQLLTAALPDGDFQTYTFDLVGNRLSLKDSRGLQTYEYDEADELLEVESDFNPEQPSMTGPLMTRLGASDANKPLFKTTYGWDADGNQVSKNGPGNKATSYTFDALDRLVGVSAPGSEPEKYLYNADRQRVAMVRGKNVVNERFLHLGRGRQVLGDLDGQGKMTKRYILLPSGQLLAHVDTSGNKPAFYHFDALGSTVVMSDLANRISARISYDPYGARRSVPEIAEAYGFVGEMGVVSHADHSVMGIRAYSPAEGRFMSRDPLYTPVLLGWLHNYGYARNNPVNQIDPEGLVNVGAILGGGGAAIYGTCVLYSMVTMPPVGVTLAGGYVVAAGLAYGGTLAAGGIASICAGLMDQGEVDPLKELIKAGAGKTGEHLYDACTTGIAVKDVLTSKNPAQVVAAALTLAGKAETYVDSGK
jgi:RHS repeat-associated protein